jgi:transposase
MIPKRWQISRAELMRRDDVCLYVSPTSRAQLDAIIRDRNSPRKLVWRAEIVIATAEGLGTNAIMRQTGKSKPCVWRWQERYMEEGIEGLKRDKTRPSRKAPLTAQTKLAVIKKTTTEKPASATHWSGRAIAKAVGLSHRSIQRIWAEAGLKPHLVRSFKLSNDPNFDAKVTDIIGLYLNPPDKAIVLCVDEKSQIQALDRTQPGLPLKKGRTATMTHDYKRNGTTTLFAALNMKTGEVIGECHPRHRAKEFIQFLRKINRTVTASVDLHLICDNYGTHKTAQVQAWLAKRPRFKLHFTPTSASWINLVERLFAEITRQRIRRGTFKTVAELDAAINEWIACRNAEPRPFMWTKTAATIIAKNQRARAVLDELKNGNQTLESKH